MKRNAVSNKILGPKGVLPLIYDLFSRPYLTRLVAKEISTFSRYYDRLIQLTAHPDDTQLLLSKVQAPSKSTMNAAGELPDLSAEMDRRTIVLLNGNLNHHFDVEYLLAELKSKLSRSSRICVVLYSAYWRWLYALANWMGIRKGALPSTYFTQASLSNICHLAGFEIVRARPVGYFPMELFGLGTVINCVLQAIPLFRWFGFTEVLILRPKISTQDRPALSIIVPARNERGNIEGVVTRCLSSLEFPFELIFVEGHSSDRTWEEIQRVQAAYAGKAKIRSFRQTGKGKSDAVRLGFSQASNELLTILDADLTMPPELLPRFYEAYASGKADFVNGSRLVYPMEGEAMRFLNWLGNVFFSKVLSWVLDARLGDTLCGTKLVSKRDYERITAWRADFGEFDPFGDFELLFSAAVLGLGIIDVPIRYRERTYGSTNINRFRHGYMLFRMTVIGLVRIRMALSQRLA